MLYCAVCCVLCTSYDIVYCVLCMWYSVVYCVIILYIVYFVYDVLQTGCDEWNACGTYLWVPNRPAPASCNTSHILHLHLLERCSVPNIPHGIRGVLQVHSRHCARTALDVMRTWELPVTGNHAVHGGVACDMYVIYVSHFSLSCMSCHSFPTNSSTYTHLASCSKLM